jgi:RimJ/RimL family protein N-acetyltransferase
MLGAGVSLRPAGPQDCDRVFAWRNHPSVRLSMIDPTELDLPRHKAWFAAALQDQARDLLIIENAGKPVGVLRFDNQGETARVSVFLDPAVIGGGLGTAALEKGIAWLRERRTGVCRIEAEVLTRNQASLMAFAKAGFTPSRQILIKAFA